MNDTQRTAALLLFLVAFLFYLNNRQGQGAPGRSRLDDVIDAIKGMAPGTPTSPNQGGLPSLGYSGSLVLPGGVKSPFKGSGVAGGGSVSPVLIPAPPKFRVQGF